MDKNTVISLYDHSGNMVRPWAKAGYDCYCIDILNKEYDYEEVGKGSITYYNYDLLVADLNLIFNYKREREREN